MKTFLALLLLCGGTALVAQVQPQITDAARQEFREMLTKAQSGDAEAQCQVGAFYTTGKGVEIDYAEAIRWLRRSAEQDFARAQSLLGTAYLLGQGVKANVVEAHAWWSLAGSSVEAVAQELKELEKRMSAQQMAEAEARAKELRALIVSKLDHRGQ